MIELADNGCFVFTFLKGDVEQCKLAMTEYRAKIPADRHAEANRHFACIAEATECTPAADCLKQFVQLRKAGTPKVCGDPIIGTVQLSPDEARTRHGLGATKFSSVPTSMIQPIEVCGLRAQLEWLVKATCDDGSQPFAGPGDPNEALDRAHAARRGSDGPGGRCKDPIDLYMIECPERTYELYIDMYLCGPGEDFDR